MAAPALTAEEELHWLALRLTPGLGPTTAGKLLAAHRTPQAIFRLAPTELEAMGMGPGMARGIASGCTFDEAVLQQEQMRRHQVALVTLTDPRYPAGLKEIHDPPIVLFARGRLELLETPMVAVVGTRRATPYGVAVTEKLASDLARAGLTIVSGMARGIDTAAHRGALSAGANTAAVLGCGVDLVYPAENRGLAAELCEKGLLLSEFPMGAPAYPQNFPIRNRTISGLSAGVLVVEGAQYSGSAITARLALEQGREVFAVPGNIISKMSWGPNLLIKQGAKLVQDWTDVVQELSPEVRRWLIDRKGDRLFQESQPPATASPANAAARQILAGLKVETATHLDDLIDELNDLSSSEIIAALFELELDGKVRQLPGKNFVKVW